MKPVKKDLALVAGLSAVGSIPSLLFPDIPGYDSPSHVAKTAFLMYSFAHGDFLGWSQFWYSGFQMFYTYSPLTYIVAGAIGWPFGSAMFGVRAVIVLSFMVSGIGTFALARDFGISRNWSIIAALLYAWASPHLLILFSIGSLTYSLAFALAPFLLLSIRLVVRRPSVKSGLMLGAAVGLLMLANSTTAYVLAIPLASYLLVSASGSRAALRIALAVGTGLAVGLLLSSFWLLPYFGVQLSGQLNLLTESKTGAYAPINVIHWYSFFIPNIQNANAGDVGWVMVIPCIFSVAFLRSRDEVALYVATLVTLLLTIGASITKAFYDIPLVLALQDPWRFMIADILFMSPLAALFFWRLTQKASVEAWLGKNQRKLIAVMILILVALVPVAATAAQKIPVGQLSWQSPSDPDQEQAFTFLSSQPGFFRVMVFDRYYQEFPEYTDKGAIDGWYDQATTVAYRNFTFNLYFCGAGSNVLGGLRLLGVRYVMIDYAYGGEATSAIESYNSSSSVFGPPVLETNETVIYQVPDSQLVYVTDSMPNSGFSPSQDVNCDAAFPTAPVDEENYSISDMDWGQTSISFNVNVTEPSYVLVSTAYAPGWTVQDNGQATQVLLSPPGLPVVRVPAGVDHITLRYEPSSLDRGSAIASLVSGSAVATALVWRRREPTDVWPVQDDASKGSQSLA